MYEPRTYRYAFNRERFRMFHVEYLETDILAGIDPGAFREDMPKRSLAFVRRLRELLDAYATSHPSFRSSHLPIPMDDHAPLDVKRMIECGQRSGTGPMASVAGLFSLRTGTFLRDNYYISELYMENGGDIFLINKDVIHIAQFAGASPLSNKLAIEIPPGEWGISTSSGTVGHSCSYGKADAVTVICRDPLISDAWATALANRIQGVDDIEGVLEFTESVDEIAGCVIICKDTLGVRGEFNIKPLEQA